LTTNPSLVVVVFDVLNPVGEEGEKLADEDVVEPLT
jgi:hypothetical protein